MQVEKVNIKKSCELLVCFGKNTELWRWFQHNWHCLDTTGSGFRLGWPVRIAILTPGSPDPMVETPRSMIGFWATHLIILVRWWKCTFRFIAVFVQFVFLALTSPPILGLLGANDGIDITPATRCPVLIKDSETWKLLDRVVIQNLGCLGYTVGFATELYSD